MNRDYGERGWKQGECGRLSLDEKARSTILTVQRHVGRLQASRPIALMLRCGSGIRLTALVEATQEDAHLFDGLEIATGLRNGNTALEGLCGLGASAQRHVGLA
jgi:hypothetical protein